MASFEMNQDMTIEILSHLPSSLFRKFRTLNKQTNSRTYESSFMKLNLGRTNSISGYFLEYSERLKVRSRFVKDLGNIPHGSEISLDFLPQGRVKTEACDASHGILLCVSDRPVRGREPEYIVCKPTTKQYVLIPRPKTRYFTNALGLMVTGSYPIRYKIMRLSGLPKKEDRLGNLNNTFVCEVFDSDSFTWKRLANVELPREEDVCISRNNKPVASCEFLHWLTTNNNVFRFSFKTETWSIIRVPENLARDRSLKLASYEGKLGVISSRSEKEVDYQELWVLESSFGDIWVKVKEFKTIGLEYLGFLSNDVVTLADVNRICLYNMNNGKSQNLQLRAPNFSPSYCSTMSYFPLVSRLQG